MKYSDAQRMAKLLDYLSRESINREQVLTDETIRWTITTPLYNIGEHVYNLSDEFKEANPGIPWSKISGLRHRLVHDYDNTNWTIINSIIFDVLPGFNEDIKGL